MRNAILCKWLAGIACIVCWATPVHAAGPAQPPGKRIAVLEFELPPGMALDRIYFSDKVRGAIGKLAPQLFVITHEGELALLQASGKSLADCEGECAVDTGRLLGADWVVSGRFAAVGRRLTLTLRLNATADGRLIATEEAEASEVDALSEPAVRAAVGLVLRLAELDTTLVLAAGPEAPVEFASEPPGAAVSLDRAQLCAATPCIATVKQGQHLVEMNKPGYASAVQTVVIKLGLRVALTLERLEGELSVESEPPGREVRLDGAVVGKTPLVLPAIAATAHVITIEDPCWLRAEQALELGRDEKRKVRFQLKPREVEVRLAATDEAGGTIVGSALFDGLRLGAAPGVLSVPVCARKLRVEAGGASAERPLALAAGVPALLEVQLPVARCSRTTAGNRLAWWAAGLGLGAGAGGMAGAFALRHAATSAPAGDSGIDAKIAVGRGLNVAGLVGLGALLVGAGALLWLPSTVDACSGVMP